MRGLGTLLRALVTLRRKARGQVDTGRKRYEVPPITEAHLADYRKALGFDADTVPLTYLYLLAQRAHVGVMLASEFPYPVMGMVHVANEMRWIGGGATAFDRRLPCEIELHVQPDPPSASGAHFLTFQVQFVQHGRVFASCSSRYLALRGRRSSGKKDEPPSPLVGPVFAHYALAEDAGRRYAKLSGDSNPIHLWRWSARLLGFKRPIMHGMHTVGRLAAELERAHGRPPQSIGVKFLKPAPLPCEVRLHESAQQIQVWQADSPVLEGSWS
jgi:acyl dehydratase